MADTGASFNRPYKPFGLNVKVPDVGEKTLKLAGGTLENIVKSPTEPLFKFLEDNEEVFTGDINYKINKSSVALSFFIFWHNFWHKKKLFKNDLQKNSV